SAEGLQGMKKCITNAALLFCLGALTLSQTAAREVSAYTVTDFLGMTLFTEIELSRNGRHVAFITSRNNFVTDRRENSIWRFDIDAQGRPIGMVSVIRQAGRFSNLRWSGDSRYLAFESLGQNSKQQLIVVDIKSNKS